MATEGEGTAEVVCVSITKQRVWLNILGPGHLTLIEVEEYTLDLSKDGAIVRDKDGNGDII